MMYDMTTTAEILGVSKRNLYELYKKGKFNMIKMTSKLYMTDELFIKQFGHNAEEIKQYSLTAKEAAAFINRNYGTFRNQAQSGKIPCIRIFDRNHFKPNDLKNIFGS